MYENEEQYSEEEKELRKPGGPQEGWTDEDYLAEAMYADTP